MALGLTFISFACAILFAFFERTEPIAWAGLIAQGDFAGVVKDAQKRGIDATLATASAAELTSLAKRFLDSAQAHEFISVPEEKPAATGAPVPGAPATVPDTKPATPAGK